MVNSNLSTCMASWVEVSLMHSFQVSLNLKVRAWGMVNY